MRSVLLIMAVLAMTLFFILFIYVYLQARRNQNITLKNLHQADTAIVLGYRYYQHDGSVSPCAAGRVNAGVKLYQNHIVSHLLMTGYDQSAFMAAQAATEGVPETAISTENQSKNTFENLYYVDTALSSAQKHRIIIVSDSYHLRRAMQLAKLRFPQADIQFFPSEPNCSKRSSLFFIFYETGATIKNALLGHYFLRTTP